MTWTKLGDEFPAEARGLTDAEFRTHVEALCWSGHRLLDLLIPKADAKRFTESPDADVAIKGLLAKRWWTDRGEAWDISPMFSDWQEERVVVDKRREDAAVRKKRSRLHKAGDHSLCLPGGVCPYVTRDKTRDETRRRGRVGTGVSPPTDPTVQDQRQTQDQTKIPAAGAEGDGNSNRLDAAPAKEGCATNSQNRRVRHASDAMADDAQGWPNHRSERSGAGSSAREHTRDTAKPAA